MRFKQLESKCSCYH